MKTSLSFACILTIVALVLAPPAGAQNFSDYSGVYNGGQVYEPGAAAGPVGMSDLRVQFPGRVWFGTNYAAEGLGFDGSYATLGMKTRLFEDMLDGRWLSETRLHHSVEDGGFFANLGVERVFSIAAAGAEVSLGAWFDYDDDQQGNFAHTFIQWGVSGSIKTKRWDLIGNGYFPEGTSNYTQGDPTGVDCFLGHSIVIVPGIDSALKGFDVTLRKRPEALAFMNGSFDIGGYGYSSDLVEFFGGGRARVRGQLMRGLIVGGEITYDDRFDVTGGVNLTIMYGANVRGAEYAGIARDLEATVRQDHITRFNQSVVLAIDPDTGRPYNVYHVDNSADPAVATGMAETPFTTLAEAEAASSADDIIFVREGLGNATGYDTGITLRDRQMLLGDGVQHLIPLADGTNFILCNDIDGNLPTITGMNNGDAVTLANGNVVRGFNIDGSLASGGMRHGIYGSGVDRGQPIDGAIIEDNVISNAILHGVFIEESIGDFTYARNNIQDNGFDGILMNLHCDPTSTILFEDNVANSNGRDGISLTNYDAEAITFLRNITNGNGRHGVNLDTFKNTAGTGIDIVFRGHQASNNNGNGINIVGGGDGNLLLFNSNIQNNVGNGIRIVDWTNTDPNTRTFIGTTTGGVSNILGNGNGTGAGIDVLLTGGVQRLTITDSTVDNNGVGIRTEAFGTPTELFTNVLDNLSVSNNRADGMRFVSRGGASHTVVVAQPTSVALGTGTLAMAGNGSVSGTGITLLVGDASGGNISLLDAMINNVAITGSGGHGIFASSVLDGMLNLTVENATASNNAGHGMAMDLNTNFTSVLNSVTVRNTTMTDNLLGAIDMTTFGGTFTDLVLVNNTFLTNISGVTGGNSDGVNISANGNTVTNPGIADNRTRVFMQNNTISGFIDHGVDLTANGDARLLLNIDGNNITGNGFGPLPNLNGINMTVNDIAEVNMRLTNNTINGNANLGINLATNDRGVINAVMVDNTIANHPNDVAIVNNLTGLVSGTICLAMSNNVIEDVPPSIFNLGPQAFFRLELDGLTNGFEARDLTQGVGAFTLGPFGSVCEGLIAAEEAAFIADGFPNP